MVAYVVVLRESMRSPEAIAAYFPLARAASAASGMKVRASKGAHETVEGEPFEAVTILEFPDIGAARAWYFSDAYQAALEFRLRGAAYRSFIVDGDEP